MDTVDELVLHALLSVVIEMHNFAATLQLWQKYYRELKIVCRFHFVSVVTAEALI